MFTEADNFKNLILGHCSINTPTDYDFYAKKISTEEYSKEDYKTLDAQNTEIWNDQELQKWWEKKTSELKEEQNKLDNIHLDKIYDNRYHILLCVVT